MKTIFKSGASVFISWLVSYCLILLVPVAFYISSYVIMKGVIDKEINAANSVMLKQVQQNMDNLFKDVQKLGLDISFYPEVEAISAYDQKVSSDNIHYTFVQLGNSFRRNNINNSSIDSFYIYFKNLDKIVSADGAAETGTMYNIVNENNDISSSEWKELLSKSYSGKFIPIQSRLKSELTASKNIAYIQSIPIDIKQQGLGNIVIMLNANRFQDMINNIQGVNQSKIFIIDNSNQVLAASGAKALPDYINYSDMNEGYGTFIKKDFGEKYTISYINSSVSQLKYVSIIPEKVYSQKSRFIQNLAGISLLIAMILGIVLSFLFSKRNYNPILDIINTLSENKVQDHEADGRNRNEYRYILEAIRSSNSEKEKIAERLKIQYSEMKENFIIKLIKGEIGEELPERDILSSMNINFDSDSYLVVLIHIDYLEKILAVPGNVFNDNKLINFAVNNVIEELLKGKHKCYTVEVNKMQACLINYNGENTLSTKEELLPIIGRLKSFIHEHYKINLSIAVGTVHETLRGIQKSYEEALKAMEYRIVAGPGSIIFYNDLDVPAEKYYYPLEEEQKFINFIKSGNFEEVTRMLEDIINTNFSTGTPSVQVAKCLMFDIASTMLKVMREVSGQVDGVFSETENPIELLLRCETILEMKIEMLSILEKICTHIQDENSNSENRFGKRAMEYIEQNYFDSNLGLQMVADYFNMTTPYVSKLFKEQTGEGLLDFINKVRVRQAKILIKNKKSSISDIAVQVGYLNINSLIRAFKRHEGITPGQFKEMQ